MSSSHFIRQKKTLQGLYLSSILLQREFLMLCSSDNFENTEEYQISKKLRRKLEKKYCKGVTDHIDEQDLPQIDTHG